MIDIDYFIKNYKKNLTNSLILGYYVHLLTDNYYNSIVYSERWIKDKDDNIIGIRSKNNKIKDIDADDKTHQKKKYKHYDFNLYGKYLYNDKEIDIPEDKKIILKNITCLKRQFLTKQDVINKIYYLNNEFKKINKLTIKE